MKGPQCDGASPHTIQPSSTITQSDRSLGNPGAGFSEVINLTPIFEQIQLQFFACPKYHATQMQHCGRVNDETSSVRLLFIFTIHQVETSINIDDCDNHGPNNSWDSEGTAYSGGEPEHMMMVRACWGVAGVFFQWKLYNSK